MRAIWLLAGALGLAFPGSPCAAENFRGVYISEFGANAQDDGGTRSGWIELHNGGAETVNLGGWFLAAERSNLTQWRFPRVGILAGGNLVVFASGDGRTNDRKK